MAEGRVIATPGRTRWVHLPAMLLLVAMVPACEQPDVPKTVKLSLAKQMFELEVAATEEQIRRGLMEREKIADDGGMIFIFADEQSRYFWMKNCIIPIDIVFVNARGRIVAVHEMQPPTDEEKETGEYKHYPSNYPAQFAVELRAGRAAELKLKAGQLVDWPLEKLKGWAR